MDWKKIGKALLFPHRGIAAALIPISAFFLVYSMAVLGTESPFSIASYVLATYTLTVWCFKIPDIVRWGKGFKTNNKYARRLIGDENLRVNLSLYGSMICNTVYAVLQLWLGFYHHTFWFYSLAGYYASLAVMRFFLVQYIRKNTPGKNMAAELKKYRVCGWVFLTMNLYISLIIFFMIYWNRTFEHHEITAIAMATYTFTAFTVAIINIKKHSRSQSPVYSASKAINLAAACVSMLTLESTMMTAFGDGTMDPVTRNIMLGASGGVISIFIISMAIYMIISSTKKLNMLKIKEKNNGK